VHQQLVTQLLKNKPLLNEASFYDLSVGGKAQKSAFGAHRGSKNHRKNATMTPLELSDASQVINNNNVMDHSTNYNFFITGPNDPTPLDLI
jgi:hypothetical protein